MAESMRVELIPLVTELARPQCAWLTVYLALGEFVAGGGRVELHWLSASPRFSGPLGDQSPAPPACQRTKSLVAPERLALSIPKALVSKTSAYAFRHGALEH